MTSPPRPGAPMTVIPLLPFSNCPSLRNAVITVLHNIGDDINFRISGLEINGGLFSRSSARVAYSENHDGVRLYPIKVDYDPTLPRRSIGGTYSSLHDALTFSFAIPVDAEDESIIVHEALHLAIDMQVVRMLALEDEALCYLAQTIFLKRRMPVQTVIGGLTVGIPLGSYLGSHPIIPTAAPLADLVIANPGRLVSRDDLRPIIDRIAANPAYNHLSGFGGTSNISDGIRNIGRSRTQPPQISQGF